MSSADFDYGSVLGAGAFGNVFHVRLHGSLHEYAMKVMQKSHIKRENKVRAPVYLSPSSIVSGMPLPCRCGSRSILSRWSVTC